MPSLNSLSLHWVAENTPELEGDAVARRELSARMIEAEREVSERLAEIFGKNSERLLYMVSQRTTCRY